MIVLPLENNVGNTFTGLVNTAFGEDAEIKIDSGLQYGNCGTVEVNGVGYDWFKSSTHITFSLAK